jgi:hypothetical protein
VAVLNIFAGAEASEHVYSNSMVQRRMTLSDYNRKNKQQVSSAQQLDDGQLGRTIE